MKFVVPLPDAPYYLWQALVQLASFRELGYDEDVHYLVAYFGDGPSELLLRLWDSTDIHASLHLYPDTRSDTSYHASMKPWLMGKFVEQFPASTATVWNYLDPDCVFTGEPIPDFGPLLADENWYGSDTRLYTGANVLRNTSEQLFLDLCAIAEIDPDMVLAHDEHTIGAQCIVKNADADFWFAVERKSVLAHRRLKQATRQARREGRRSALQSWCAEMWMQQYETIRAGFTPRASPLMGFCWANAPEQAWHEQTYFHCAGQATEDGHHFCKSAWKHRSPFGKQITVSPESASWHYVELIRRTEAMFPELIWD